MVLNSRTADADEIAELAQGGQQAVAEAFARHVTRLERMIQFRLDRRLLPRVDPADILQEAYIEIARRIADYLDDPRVCFFVWARQITWQTLLMVHRRHFGRKRDPNQEVAIGGQRSSDTGTFSLAQCLFTAITSPSHAAMREERFEALRRGVDALADIDREILMLRHFEQLSNSQTAQIIGLSPTAASNRYVRALKRLRGVLESESLLRDELARDPP